MEDVVRLVYPNREYEYQALEYMKEMELNNSSYAGCAMLEQYLDNYSGWLDKLERFKNNPDEGYSRSGTYFMVRESDNKILGFVDLRYDLTDFLFNYGGHIGYSIRPSERRKGYATKLLTMALEKYRELNIDKVLVCCNKNNIGSRKVILANNGIFENEVPKKGEIIQRYWINL